MSKEMFREVIDLEFRGSHTETIFNDLIQGINGTVDWDLIEEYFVPEDRENGITVKVMHYSQEDDPMFNDPFETFEKYFE